MVSANWQEDAATALLEIMIDQIRGHSTATEWLEKYKQDKMVQKSKGVRKQLILKSLDPVLV
jgi:hypothetical protein